MILPDNFDFTQGNLQDYIDCPYRFYMKYILHIQWPALVVNDALEFEAHLQAGTRFHRFIQQFLIGVDESFITDMASVDPYPELQIWWEGFLANVPAWLTGERWIETSLTTTLAGQRLVAKYDLILIHPNDESLLIFDWKTANNLPRRDWLLSRIQTRLYRFILAQAGGALISNRKINPDDISMCYWYAPHPKIRIDLPYSLSDYEHDLTAFTSLIEEIVSAAPSSFERTQNQRQCRYCVYRSHCDRGIEAGNLADIDDYDYEIEASDLDISFDDLPEIEF